MAERRSRSGFGPVVLVGLAASGLLAVAASKPWYAAAVDVGSRPGLREPDTEADMPLALALALVVLAAWGVVLVSRTLGRRVALTLAALASAGAGACVVAATASLPGQVREQLDGAAEVDVAPTGWFVVAAIGALLALVAAVHGWRVAPGWPSMGAKYDAPAGAPAGETDLWKAFDAGQDPTAADRPEAP